jgi:AcrR family transcriptional regulator
MKLAEADTPGKRRYRMTARAEAAAATRQAIVDAYLAVLVDRNYDEITLDSVAERAGVTVQTVIRRFGSKEELFAAVARETGAQEAARRAEAVPGDVRDAVRSVVAHYERIGDVVLRLLGQEDRFPALREVTDAGRKIHYGWVERAFSPFLEPMTAGMRRRRRGQLVVLTDVFTWRLLRRDLGFGQRQTELAMTEMVKALLNGGN